MAVSRTMVWLVFVAAWLGPVSAAAGEPGLVVISGGADERDRRAVGAGIEAAAREAGWSLPGTPLSKQDTDRLFNCPRAGEPWTCVPSSVSALGVHRVFLVAVERSQAANGAPMIVITGKVIVTAPEDVVTGRRFCEHCADDRLSQESGVLARELLQSLAIRTDRTVLDIKSIPPGAEIVLDGTRIGATDATFSTFSGRHVIVVSKPGYTSRTVEVVAAAGKTAQVSVTLRGSTESSAAPPSPTRRSRLLPKLVLGAGAAAVLAGTVALVYDEDPVGPGEPASRTYTDTAAPGLALVAGGAVAAGIASYLLWRQPRTTAPTVTPIAGGAVVGLSRTF